MRRKGDEMNYYIHQLEKEQIKSSPGCQVFHMQETHAAVDHGDDFGMNGWKEKIEEVVMEFYVINSMALDTPLLLFCWSFALRSALLNIFSWGASPPTDTG